jgi:hypothetical protein
MQKVVEEATSNGRVPPCSKVCEEGRMDDRSVPPKKLFWLDGLHFKLEECLG